MKSASKIDCDFETAVVIWLVCDDGDEFQTLVLRPLTWLRLFATVLGFDGEGDKILFSEKR
jgi:hypothetical protein